MSSTSVGAEFPDDVRTPPAPRVPRYRSVLVPLSFLAPALVLLFVWVIYPALATAKRSLYDDQDENNFVGLDNWDRMVRDPTVHTAFKNNVIWILIAPVAVTVFGLVLAVLTERISWASLFKIVLFMPLAISLFAVGVIWRIVYTQDPDQGLLNAGTKAIHDIFVKPGVLPGAQPGQGLSSSFTLTKPIEAGGDGHCARGHTVGRRAGRGPEAGRGEDRGRRLARLQAGRREAGCGGEGGDRDFRGDRHAAQERRQDRDGDDGRRRLVHVRRRQRGRVHRADRARDVPGAVGRRRVAER